MIAPSLFSPTEPTSALLTLRPYQNRAVVEVAKHWAAGRSRVLLVAPTGAGKTVMAGALVHAIERKGRRVLFLCHRDVLVGQTVETFARWGITAGFIKAGYREDRNRLVQIGSVQSLARRDWWASQEFDFDTLPVTVILDEAHTTGWATVVRELLEQHPALRVCGLTATPWRLIPREDMGDIFQAAVCAPFPADLIADGFLVPPSYFGTRSAPDLSHVRTRAGDYVEEDLAEACDTPEMVSSLVDDWQRLTTDEPLTLAFATNVLHAYHIAREFSGRGITARGIDANTPIDERTALYAAFRCGDIRILSSVGVLQEGFDVPEVGCCLLARPTKSRALYVQQLGRGLRIAPWVGKQSCTIIDQSGNVGRFGFTEDFDHFELKLGNPDFDSRKAQSEPDAEVKTCPTCQAIVKRLTPICPSCGYLWPLKKSGYAQKAQALVRTDLTTADKMLLYRDLLHDAYRRSYKPESASVRFRDSTGQWPSKEWARGAIFGTSSTSEQRADYIAYLADVAAQKGMLPFDAAAWQQRWIVAEMGE